jgi:micrococcal nuclease
MKKLAALIIIFILLAGCGTSGEKPATGLKQEEKKGNWIKVSRVIDGDTFEIVNRGTKERVRLIGVDTPETVKPDSPAEPFGKEASDFTRKMIEGKMVRLEFDVQERDKYGRLLAYVYLEDGTMLNSRLLEEGLASIVTIPPNVRMADTFLKIQRKARQEKKGIWKD